MTSCGPQALCNGPETLTQWKSVSVSIVTCRLTGVGAKGAYKSKIDYLASYFSNILCIHLIYLPIYQFHNLDNGHHHCNGSDLDLLDTRIQYLFHGSVSDLLKFRIHGPVNEGRTQLGKSGSAGFLAFL